MLVMELIKVFLVYVLIFNSQLCYFGYDSDSLVNYLHSSIHLLFYWLATHFRSIEILKSLSGFETHYIFFLVSRELSKHFQGWGPIWPGLLDQYLYAWSKAHQNLLFKLSIYWNLNKLSLNSLMQFCFTVTFYLLI